MFIKEASKMFITNFTKETQSWLDLGPLYYQEREGFGCQTTLFI